MGSFLLAAPHPAHAAVQYYRTITMNGIASGTQSNFPLYVGIATSTYLKSTSTGGGVQSAIGNDILFSALSNCAQPLDFITEAYSSSTGGLIAEVNVPSMSAGSQIYLCYGNTAAAHSRASANITGDTSLVGYWPLNENSGTVAYDRSGNDQNGSWTGTPAGSSGYYSPGKVGSAVGTFDGSTDYVMVPHGVWNTGAPTSYSFWYTQNTGVTIGSGLTNVNAGSFAAEAGGRFAMYDAASTDTGCSVGSVTPGWHLETVTLTSTHVNCYSDGSLAQSVAILGFNTTSYDLYFGSRGEVPDNFDNGSISNVRAYSRALSDSWIADEYNNENDPPNFYTIGSEQSEAFYPFIDSFGASPSSLIFGNPSVSLSWSTAFADTVSIDQGIGNQTATSTGSVSISPSSATTYTLTATNGLGTSTAATTVTVIPSTPTNLVATDISPTEIDLSWTPSIDGVPIAGYDIFRCTGSSCTPSAQITTSPSASYADVNLPGLTSSSTYTYSVAAFDGDGNTSFHSSFASAMTPPIPGSSAPYNASALLGQTDKDGNAVYTSNAVNDQGGVNALGFDNPDDMTLDPVNHRLFIVDNYNNRVLIFALDANNNIATTTPSYVLGQSNFTSSGSGCTPVQNNFCDPRSLAYDSINQRLFVVDQYNYRVLVFDANPSTIANDENAQHVLGQPDFFSNNMATTQNGLWNPHGVAFDPSSERLFVAEGGNFDFHNNRVMVFNVDPLAIADGENALNVIGQPDFASSATTTSQSSLSGPQGIALDIGGERLFVADTSHQRVMVFNIATSTIADGENALNVLGQANFTSSTSRTNQSGFASNGPHGLSYDPATGRLFVADSGSLGANNRVLVFNAATSTITNGENAVNVLGQSNYVSSSSAITQNGFSSPRGVMYDPSTHNLYVGEQANNRVMVFNAATSTITDGENAFTELGQYDANGAPVYTKGGRDNPRVNNQRGFNQPYAATIDATNHRLFVADNGNNRVLVFQLDATNSIATTSAMYVLGQPDFATTITTTTQSQMYNPEGLAYDPVSSRLFVSDQGNGRILIFNVAPGTIANGENASYVLGQNDFITANFTGGPNGFNGPQGLAYDPVSSRLFVSDYGNNRVLVFDVATSTILSGEDAEHVLGQSNLNSHGNATAQNGMYNPNGLAYDSVTSRLFVADSVNTRVLVFDAATSTISDGENAEKVLGHADFVSNSYSAAQDGMSYLQGLAYDPATGRLFVADGNYNSRVLIFNAATSTIANGESASNVLGQTDFVSTNSATTQSGMFYPHAVTYDPSNQRLFVADMANNRILEFTFIVLTTPSLPAGTAGSSYSQTLTTANGQGTLAFVLASGSLPPGLTLDPSSGVITGTPTTAGTYPFTVRAMDEFTYGGYSAQVSYSLSIGAPSQVIAVAGGYGGGSGGGSSPVTPPAPPVVTPPPSSSTLSPSSVVAILASIPKILPTDAPALQNIIAKLQLVYLILTQQTLSAAPPPVQHSYVFTRDLFFGMTGTDVTNLQRFLIGEASGPEAAKLKVHGLTKNFATLTVSALIEFQKKAGIVPASGSFGPKTRAYVNAHQ